mgnify:CR=1 FL=1
MKNLMEINEKEYDTNVLRARELAYRNRQDVGRILRMNNQEFKEWYEIRRNVLERILQEYKLATSIPNLLNASIEEEMSEVPAVSRLMNGLSRGLEYLEEIVDLRSNRYFEKRIALYKKKDSRGVGPNYEDIQKYALTPEGAIDLGKI